MNARTQRLQPAVDLAHQRSEDALAELAHQQQQLARAEQQLEELERYRNEYAIGGSEALSVAALLNRQGFIDKIDHAIRVQVAEVARQKRLLDRVRDHWQQAHARESALGTVVAHQLEHERRAEDRREQAEADERTQHRRAR